MRGAVSSAEARDVAAILAFAAVMLAFGWTGFLAGDDMQYEAAARAWLETGVFGRGTAALRPTVVLPIALSFSIFGPREIALVLPTVAYFLGLLLLTYAAVRRAIDRPTALAAALLLASTPLFALIASVASPDLAELFFVAASLWLFHGAGESRWWIARLVGAGLAAGLAAATRETSFLLLGYYGLLALREEPEERRSFRVVLLSAAVVLIAELGYLGAVTGNPFVRLWTDWMKQQELPRKPTGNIEVNRWVNPFLALLLNQEFALLFFLATPAALRMCFGRGGGERRRETLRFLCAFGALWFVGVGYCPWLRNLPRYFSVTTYCAVIALAAWASVSWSAGRRAAALAVVGILVASNLTGIYLDNRDPLYGVRRLVDVAKRARETVYTDPETAEAAAFLLSAAHVRERVSSDPPPAGALFLHDPTRAAANGDRYAPRAEWRELERFDPGRKLSGRVAEWLGIDAKLPAEIARKLDRPNPVVTLYRVSG